MQKIFAFVLALSLSLASSGNLPAQTNPVSRELEQIQKLPESKPVAAVSEKEPVSSAKLKYPQPAQKSFVDAQESKVKVSTAGQAAHPASVTEPIVVTATRHAQPVSQIALPVTVITREDIERQGDLQVYDALRSVPGLTILRSGPRGRVTSLFLRGANSNQVLFMVDGVEYTSPGTGNFNPTNILLEDIERIEVIKGPQSTLYGSDAMGGVIHVITRKGKLGRPKINGKIEYGSERTLYEAGTVSGQIGKFDYLGSIARLDSTTGTAKRRIENDRYEDINVSGRGGMRLPANSKLELNYRFMSGFTPVDDGAFLNDSNRWSKTKDNTLGTFLTLNPFTWLKNILKFSYFDERTLSVDPADSGLRRPQIESVFKLDAQVYTFDWQNEIRPFETNTVTGGYEYEIQRADNRTFDRILRNGGYYIQDQQSFWDRLFLTAGVRLEENNAFGNSLNPKISAAYLIKKTNTKFKADFGTGFRTPTLNQLYFPNFGNPGLRPEESRSFDWGVEQTLPFWDSKIGADMYHTHFNNLIQAVANPLKPGWSMAANTGKAVVDGIELSVDSQPIKKVLTLSGFYSYMVTVDKSLAGSALLRRPKNSGGVTVNLHLWDKWNLNVDANFVGNRKDSSFVFGRPRFEVNKGYGILNAKLSYDVTKYWQVYAHGENITNEDYEDVLGFQTSGALLFGGVKMNY
ncbi:MAG: TonB-dependent receptor [Candidatus Omnitrophica bacterium]|nr:TonB-dependent receptor [Candidatus Omnitrophota bacterium]